MNKTVLTIIVLFIIILAGYLMFKGPETTAPTLEKESLPATSSTTGQEPQPSGSSTSVGGEVKVAAGKKVVTYTNSSFSPNTLTIKVGDSITWKNESSQNMWVASAMHPTHTVYSGTSLSAHCPDTAATAFDACKGVAPGESWSFTFTKAGTWGYHDHLHASLFGKIVVE